MNDKIMNDRCKNLQIYCDKNLGTGSYSKVFPGKYKNKMVAVKIILTKYLDKKIIIQLQRELEIIRILQKNPHPNIVKYYKIINTEDEMIIVMELCSGGELLKLIKNRIDKEKIKDYHKQITSGFKHLINMNIMHRDIKSTNILLSEDKKTIKIIDFGLSKIITNDLNKTICGSPLYMAPELLKHQKYNTKSDIWSIGILLYEMIYGNTPFHYCKDIKTLKGVVESHKIVYHKNYYNDSKEQEVEFGLIKYLEGLLKHDVEERIGWDNIDNINWELKEEGNNNIGINDLEEDYLLTESDILEDIEKDLDNALDLSTEILEKINGGKKLPKPIPIPQSLPLKNNVRKSVSYSPIKQYGIFNESFDNMGFTPEINEKYISSSGLVSIDDIHDTLIMKLPEKTTAYEYIRNSSSSFGSYVYSKSAPVVSFLQGVGVGKK